jgi:hypothetical protein
MGPISQRLSACQIAGSLKAARSRSQLVFRERSDENGDARDDWRNNEHLASTSTGNGPFDEKCAGRCSAVTLGNVLLVPADRGGR